MTAPWDEDARMMPEQERRYEIGKWIGTWLFESPKRRTGGMPWRDEHIADVGAMLMEREDALAARLADLESLATRWYLADGTFETLPEEEVIQRRKEAAKTLGRIADEEAVAKVLFRNDPIMAGTEMGLCPWELAPDEIRVQYLTQARAIIAYATKGV